MNDYPEHEKLQAISDKSQTIYDFLEWVMAERGLSLGEWVPDDSGWNGRVLRDPETREALQRFMPATRSRRELLAAFFDIDLNKIEDEKRAMLDELRSAANAVDAEIDAEKR